MGFPSMIELIILHNMYEKNMTAIEDQIIFEIIKTHSTKLVSIIKNAAKVIDEVFAA